MKNKSIIIISIIFALIFISITSLAADDMGNNIKNGMHSITNTVVDGTQNLSNDIKSGVGATENFVENGVKSIGNTISGGIQNIGNFMSDGMNNVSNTIDDNDEYSVTRTSATDELNASFVNTSVWTWIILAIAAVIIVSLVWYYGTQHRDIDH